jgi:thiamine-phosphate pyrophosphorylase
MHDALRIIDANFNRSREGLRVMEEYARFCLADASLTERCKTLRHDLGNVICGLQLKLEAEGAVLGDRASAQGKACGSGGRSARESREDQNFFIAARDTVGDVGTKISNESEYARRDALHVAIAAAKRLTESLRAIEEYGKIIDEDAGRRVEQLRYVAYEIERDLMMTASAKLRFSDVRLYVLITEAFCAGDWFDTARAVLDNGADCVQLREKSLTDAEMIKRATRLAELCRDSQKLLIVNDRPDIAAVCGAHGVHLGQDDMSVRSARRIMPAGAIVGLSTHTTAQVDAAIADTPDYIAVGPIFPSATKPQDNIAGIGTLIAASEQTALPLVAIGGLDAKTCGDALSSVGCCICVCSSVISQTNVANATRKIRSAIDEAWQLRQNG